MLRTEQDGALGCVADDNFHLAGDDIFDQQAAADDAQRNPRELAQDLLQGREFSLQWTGLQRPLDVEAGDDPLLEGRAAVEVAQTAVGAEAGSTPGHRDAPLATRGQRLRAVEGHMGRIRQRAARRVGRIRRRRFGVALVGAGPVDVAVIGDHQDAQPAAIAEPFDGREIAVQGDAAALRFELVVVAQPVNGVIVDHEPDAVLCGRRHVPIHDVRYGEQGILRHLATGLPPGAALIGRAQVLPTRLVLELPLAVNQLGLELVFGDGQGSAHAQRRDGGQRGTGGVERGALGALALVQQIRQGRAQVVAQGIEDQDGRGAFVFQLGLEPLAGGARLWHRAAGVGPDLRPLDHQVLPAGAVGRAQGCDEGEQLGRGAVQVAGEFLAGAVNAPAAGGVPGDGLVGSCPVAGGRGVKRFDKLTTKEGAGGLTEAQQFVPGDDPRPVPLPPAPLREAVPPEGGRRGREHSPETLRVTCQVVFDGGDGLEERLA